VTAPTGGPDFKFVRRGGVCAGCGAALAPGATSSSALYDEPASGDAAFSRKDFCAACFDDAAKRGEPFSWWTAVVPTPQEKKAVFDVGVAREFLVRLLKEDAPERASLRYLLALLLMRKKAVKVGDQFVKDGLETMVLSVPPDEQVFEVPCLEIDEAEATKLRDDLGKLFAL
jgi:hypothetical protein